MPDRKKALIAGARSRGPKPRLAACDRAAIFVDALDDWDLIAVYRRKPDVEGR